MAASFPKVWAGYPAKNRHEKKRFEPYFFFLLDSGSTLGFTFLNHRSWGGNTNFDLKLLMLDHAFRHFAKVWFHIAPTNIPSRKATAKLGAKDG